MLFLSQKLKRPVVRTTGLSVSLVQTNRYGLSSHDYLNLESRHHHLFAVIVILVRMCLVFSSGCKVKAFYLNRQKFFLLFCHYPPNCLYMHKISLPCIIAREGIDNVAKDYSLFHLLKVGILDVVVGVRTCLLTALETGALIGVGAWLACTGLLVHLL